MNLFGNTELVKRDWYSLFNEYVAKGYYQKFIKDLSTKYTKYEIDIINESIRLTHIQELSMLYPELGIISLDNDLSTIHCDYLKQSDLLWSPVRFMVGNHGIYAEFHKESLPLSDENFVKKRMQYLEYRINGYKIYSQFLTVNYADYKPNFAYIAIIDYLNLINNYEL